MTHASIPFAVWRATVSDHDGHLPDGVVIGTDQAIWEDVLAAVEERGWIVHGEDADEMVVARVRPGSDVLVIIRRYECESIDFDVDLRELLDQPALDALCKFMSVVGRASRRDVSLFAEGSQSDPNSTYLTYRWFTDHFERAPSSSPTEHS